MIDGIPTALANTGPMYDLSRHRFLFAAKWTTTNFRRNINREVCFGNLSILAGETEKNHSSYNLITEIQTLSNWVQCICQKKSIHWCPQLNT